MPKENEINLQEILDNVMGIRVQLDRKYLRELMIKASKSDKPHCDMNFIKSLELKPTTKYLNTTIYGWMEKEGSIQLRYLSKISKLADENWKKIQENIMLIRSGEGGLGIKNIFPIKLDRRLGSIIGHILGDGSIDKKYQQVFFSNSEKALLIEFSTNMEQIFGIKPRIWMQKPPEYGNTQWDKRLNNLHEVREGRSVGLFYPTICGLLLNSIFDNFAIGKDKKITFELLNANKEFKRGMIRAFYDDESTVGQKNIRVFQDRKDILEIFRELLKEFSISSSEVRAYLKHDKERFYFDIFRKSNFEIFNKEIGFTSPQKNAKLRRLLIVKRPSMIK